MVFEVELFFYPPKSPLSKGDFQVGGLSRLSSRGTFKDFQVGCVRNAPTPISQTTTKIIKADKI